MITEDLNGSYDSKSMEGNCLLERSLSIRTRESSTVTSSLHPTDEPKESLIFETHAQFLEEVLSPEDEDGEEVLISSFTPRLSKPRLTCLKLKRIQDTLAHKDAKNVRFEAGEEVHGFEDFAEVQHLPTMTRYIDRATSSCLSDYITYLDERGEAVTSYPIVLPQGDSYDTVKIPGKNKILVHHRVALESLPEFEQDEEINESDGYLKRWVLVDFETKKDKVISEYECPNLFSVTNATLSDGHLFFNVNDRLHSLKVDTVTQHKEDQKVAPQPVTNSRGQPIKGAVYSIFGDNIYVGTTQSGNYCSGLDPLVAYWESRDRMTLIRHPGEPEPVLEVAQKRISLILRAKQMRAQTANTDAGQTSDDQEDDENLSQASFEEYSKKVIEDAEPVDTLMLFSAKTRKMVNAVRILPDQDVSHKISKPRIVCLRKINLEVLAISVSISSEGPNSPHCSKIASAFPKVTMMCFADKLSHLCHTMDLRFCSIEQLTKMHKHPVRLYGQIFFPLICYQQISDYSVIKVLTLVTIYRRRIHVLPIRLDPAKFDPLLILGSEVLNSKSQQRNSPSHCYNQESSLLRLSVLSGASRSTSRLDEIKLYL